MMHVLQVWLRQHAAAYSGDHAGRPYELTLLVSTVLLVICLYLFSLISLHVRPVDGFLHGIAQKT